LVFQSFNLFPQYTVLENLMLAKELIEKSKKKDGMTKEQIKEQAYELLKNVGLTEKAESYPCELSGGQQQRVAIARALSLNPEVLCFDEPTSALDPELTGEVLRVIKELKSADRTMIIVTHELGFARNVSDRIMFIADGRIEEEGTPDEVFDNPKSAKMRAFLNKSLERL
ncbi:MAG: amino acid ABC transporter ATP-binding protein, partial [Clostridia bacterium]|nr:amino acid ABC transporter ATP-binding protein [Clostridia bacterium]